VNLVDEYTLQVRGRLRLTGDGYVAADHGTRLVLIGTSNLSGGRFELRNNGGWYEGRNPYNLPLSTISNNGFVYKSNSVGTSVLEGKQSGTGTAEVASGTLALNGTGAVQVQPARQYSSGRCNPAIPIADAYACKPIAFSGDKQIASVRVGAQDPGGAKVSLREAARTIPGFGRTQVVDTSGMSVTRSHPAVLTLRYDAAVRAGRSPASVKILHQHGPGPYATVPTCAAHGHIPASAVACVDRRPAFSRVAGDGDLIMVVRTIRFSRWVAR
jgi:hypothetical protein